MKTKNHTKQSATDCICFESNFARPPFFWYVLGVRVYLYIGNHSRGLFQSEWYFKPTRLIMIPPGCKNENSLESYNARSLSLLLRQVCRSVVEYTQRLQATQARGDQQIPCLCNDF